MSRKSNLAAVINREVQRRLSDYTNCRMQMAFDAAVLAANEVFNMGAARAAAFGEAFIRYSDEIAGLFTEDGKSDDTLEYSKATLDRRIKKIVGNENFVPFNERYGWVSDCIGETAKNDQQEMTRDVPHTDHRAAG